MNRGNSNFRGRGGYWRGRGSYQRGGRSKLFTDHSKASTSDTSIDESQNSQQSITNIFEPIPCPYSGWKLYHILEPYKDGSETVSKVQAVEKFIRKYIKIYSASEIIKQKSFSVDIKVLAGDEEFNAVWPDFKQELFVKPEYTLGNLGLAMHQVLASELQSKLKPNEEKPVASINLPLIHARITNYEPILQLKHVKTHYHKKLVAIHGTVIRVGSIKLLCMWMAFECLSCHALQCVKQPDGVFTLPTKCRNMKCKSKNFIPLYSSPYTRTINWQSIRLQEMLADDQREGGRVPRTIECELTEDLLDTCLAGDVVTIIGIIKAQNTEVNTNRKTASTFSLYLDGKSVINNKNETITSRNSGFEVQLDVKDFCAIKEIRTQPSLFKLLVHSLCPSIYGHELVKAGLLLTLFGGSQNDVESRSNSHILIVGDPGLGKSQMLQACANVAPRGVYVCGTSTTANGLTVTLTRESGSDYALEAGAVVLADRGCCCIDEFDKMTSQHPSLMEMMEQQSVSIAKAGVLCTLPARTSIIAAANPSGGHYNRAKTVAENLRLGSPLLSRFDLVFILLDLPNEHMDTLLSEHVMALHSGVKHKTSTALSQLSGLIRNDKIKNSGEPQPLQERLKLNAGEELDHVPHQLLRKYIAYARKYINPHLTNGAAEVLQKFYLDLRKKHQTIDSTPVTTRQLESLIRLAEARAKLELRDEISASDALDVVDIMCQSLVDTFNDGTGGLDFQRSQNGSGLSNKNRAKKFINVLQKRADMLNRSTFSVDELKEIAVLNGVQANDFGNFIASLNTQGFLLKKGPKLYQLLTIE